MFSDSTSRSSHAELFCKKVVLKISAIFTGKHLRWSLFLIKLQGLQHRWKENFPVNIGIFKNSFSIEHLWWLLLNFFTGFQKEKAFSINRSVMKTFKCSFPIDFAFNPIQDGPLWGCSRIGEGKKGPFSLKSGIHILQWWNLVDLYLT